MLTELFEATPETQPGRALVYSLDTGEVLDGPPSALLQGYRALRGITFSASLKGLVELLAGYEEVELLLGLEEGYGEAALLAGLREELGALLPLLERRFTVAYLPGNHAKLYLLSHGERVRTVVGSLNLSHAAWSGAQGEIALFSDREEVYRLFEAYFLEARGRARPLLGPRERGEILGGGALPLVALTALPPKEAERLAARARGVILVNAVRAFPKEGLERDRQEWEAELRALKGFLREYEEAARALKLPGGREAYLKRLVESALKESRILTCRGDAAYYRGLPLSEVAADGERARETVAALNELLSRAEGGAPSLRDSMGEALVYAFASTYLPALRREAALRGRDPMAFPAFTLLVGRAGTGKTTALRAITGLWGIPYRTYEHVEETRSSRADTLWGLLTGTEEAAPLVLDEVPPGHLTERNRLVSVLKVLSSEAGVGRTLILASNLEDLRSEEQVLRRVVFLLFEHKPLPPERPGATEEILKAVHPDLLLLFLKERLVPGAGGLLPAEGVEGPLEGDDPFRPARAFLLERGVKVPERPFGDYRAHLLRFWRLLYLTQPDLFTETLAPDARTGRMVPCYVVQRKDLGFLAPLPAFDNGFMPGDRRAFLIRRDDFLKAIGAAPRGKPPLWARLLGRG